MLSCSDLPRPLSLLKLPVLLCHQIIFSLKCFEKCFLFVLWRCHICRFRTQKFSKQVGSFIPGVLPSSFFPAPQEFYCIASTFWTHSSCLPNTSIRHLQAEILHFYTISNPWYSWQCQFVTSWYSSSSSIFLLNLEFYDQLLSPFPFCLPLPFVSIITLL